MPHIHDQPNQHDHTISAYIVRGIGSDEPKIMMHLHQKLKKYLMFGGHIELDEQPWHALMREMDEETGYKQHQLQVLQPKAAIQIVGDAISHPLPLHINTHRYAEDSDHFHNDLVYVLAADEEPEGSPREGESEDIESFSKQQLEAFTDKEMPQNIKAVCLEIFSLLETKRDYVEIVPASSFSTSLPD